MDRERRALSQPALHGDVPAQGLDDPFGHGQPEARAGLRPRGVGSVEGLEHVREGRHRDAFAGVLHHHVHPAVRPARLDGDRPVRRGVADRVLDQILEDPGQPGRACGIRGAVQVGPDGHALQDGVGLALGHHGADDVRDPGPRRLGLDGPGVELHQLEQVVHQRDQRVDRPAHFAGVPPQGGGIVDHALVDGLDHGSEACQGGAQVVRHGGDQVPPARLHVADRGHGLSQAIGHAVKGGGQGRVLGPPVHVAGPHLEIASPQGTGGGGQAGDGPRRVAGQHERGARSGPHRVAQHDQHGRHVVPAHEHQPGQDREVRDADQEGNERDGRVAKPDGQPGQQRTGRRHARDRGHRRGEQEQRQMAELVAVHPGSRPHRDGHDRPGRGGHRHRDQPAGRLQGSNR